MMKLSIIIPMYNAASSIEKCLESTQKQDLDKSDYEVVVINDGSKDESLAVTEAVIVRYNNIHVYSQENGGLSAARNAGIERAKGNYILFLDSDDWIADNYLRKIVDTCEKNDLDMLRICAANVIDGVPYRRFTVKENEVITGAKALNNNLPACAPFAIYRRRFLDKHQLRFYPGIYHEDNEFTPRAYYLAKRVAGINDIIYYVYQTQGSITRSVNVKKPLDITIVMQNLDVFFKTYVQKEDRGNFHRIIAGAMNSALHQTQKMTQEDKKKVNDAFYGIRHLFVHACKSPSIDYRIAGIMYSLFPHHVVEVYNALHFRF